MVRVTMHGPCMVTDCPSLNNLLICVKLNNLKEPHPYYFLPILCASPAPIVALKHILSTILSPQYLTADLSLKFVLSLWPISSMFILSDQKRFLFQVGSYKWQSCLKDCGKGDLSLFMGNVFQSHVDCDTGLSAWEAWQQQHFGHSWIFFKELFFFLLQLSQMFETWLQLGFRKRHWSKTNIKTTFKKANIKE